MIWGTALDNRDRQPEVMDQPGLDPREHAKALTGLRRINTISRCSAGLFRPIEALAINQTTTPRLGRGWWRPCPGAWVPRGA